MKRTSWRFWLVLALLPVGACMATVGVNNVSIPKNSAKICAGHCRSIGLTLSAVAIMAENVGCVCQAAGASDKNEKAAGEMTAPAAGMATIALQAAAQAAAADQQRRPAAARH
jgi:hypothetical protein